MNLTEKDRVTHERINKICSMKIADWNVLTNEDFEKLRRVYEEK